MKNDYRVPLVSDTVQDDTNEDDDNIDNIVKLHNVEIELQTPIYCVRQLLLMNRICSCIREQASNPAATIAIVKNWVFCSCYSCKDRFCTWVHLMKDDITHNPGLYNNEEVKFTVRRVEGTHVQVRNLHQYHTISRLLKKILFYLKQWLVERG